VLRSSFLLGAFTAISFFLAGIVSAQVVIEYRVDLPEGLDSTRQAAIPERIMMATNGERVFVRGYWNNPRNNFQLYIPDKALFYHCDIEGKTAVEYPMELASEILESMNPPVQIAGLWCKQALAVIGTDTFSIAYTDAFGMNFCPVANIPGFALRYTRIFQGVKIAYEAVKYRLEQLPDSLFVIENRRIIRPDAADEYLEGRRWAMQIGRRAPNVKGGTLSGTKFGPKSYKGKTLVVDFHSYKTEFASTLDELNWFQHLADDFANDKDVVFAVVFLEDEFFLKKIIPHEAFSFPILFDGQFYQEALRLDLLPASIVVNPFNLITERVIGHNAISEVRLRRAIELSQKGGLEPIKLD
jgi:hypothetical protein